jgi:hypothetical protein
MGKKKSDNLENFNEEITQYTEKLLDEFIIFIQKEYDGKLTISSDIIPDIIIYKFMKKKGYIPKK